MWQKIDIMRGENQVCPEATNLVHQGLGASLRCIAHTMAPLSLSSAIWPKQLASLSRCVPESCLVMMLHRCNPEVERRRLGRPCIAHGIDSVLA